MEEVQAAWVRVAKRAGAKLHGQNVEEAQRTRERDTVVRWAKAEGTDLENAAQRAKQKLSRGNGAQE